MASAETISPSESTTEQYWQKHFKYWQESGLTQSDYCRQAELSRHRFKYWRRKLEPASVPRRNKKRETGFVPVQVRPSSVEASLTLALPNGMVVRGIDAGNVELIKRLVAQL
jgi:hypothetical protein